MTKRQYRELLALLPEGVGITDLDENLVFVNDAFAQILGYDLDELRGMNVFDFVSEDETDGLIEGDSEADGDILALSEGLTDGLSEGDSDGLTDGEILGLTLGDSDGEGDSDALGLREGDSLG